MRINVIAVPIRTLLFNKMYARAIWLWFFWCSAISNNVAQSYCGVQKWLRIWFYYLRDIYRNYFTGLGRLGNICRNSGVSTESERWQPALRGTLDWALVRIIYRKKLQDRALFEIIRLGVPPWSIGAFFRQKITAISRLLSLEFWCSKGHVAQFDLMLTLFLPILTYFDLFCRADLTHFHRFWPILPCGPDLFPPISTYFVLQ